MNPNLSSASDDETNNFNSNKRVRNRMMRPMIDDLPTVTDLYSNSWYHTVFELSQFVFGVIVMH